tara:strand:- start:623 stop:853 length:231 start_codon:yes stop_codon:yes gene_type:complete
MAERKNSYHRGFFLGGNGMICAMYKIGDISENKAKQYIGWNKSYILENRNIDFKVKNYAENYRFTGGNKDCNRLID